MLKNSVAILDIGSLIIRYFIGGESVNGTFNVSSIEQDEYNSFYEGEFDDVKVFKDKITTLHNKLLNNNNLENINKVFVSVPSEFCKTICKNYRISFSKPKKITNKDVSDLFTLAYENVSSEHSLINQSSVYYVIDNIKTHEPLKVTADNLGGRLTYSLVLDTYKEVILNIFKELNVKTVVFISQDLAEAIYLFKDFEREDCRILLDIGYATSSINVSVGDGILYSNAFSIGGGVIEGGLMKEFGIDYDIAKSLKSKLNLGLVDSDYQVYTVLDGDKPLTFSRTKSNQIAKSVLDEIVEHYKKIVSSCTIKIPEDIDVYVTGDGITLIRGAVEYLCEKLGVYPKIKTPNLPHYKKPYSSSMISLLYTAIKYKEDNIFFKQ